MSENKTGAKSPPKLNTPISELVWLFRLRQAGLPLTGSLSKAFSWENEGCDDPDCLPWFHKRKECRKRSGTRFTSDQARRTDPLT